MLETKTKSEIPSENRALLLSPGDEKTSRPTGATARKQTHIWDIFPSQIWLRILCLKRVTSFLLPKPCCFQRRRNTTAAVSSWEKERKSPPPSLPDHSHFVPLCPAPHRPVHLFGASLRPIQLLSHVSDYVISINPFTGISPPGGKKKKLSTWV